ncbi:hypothetical protein JRQ81_014242 [Phrynocephalus forsythii]|uniref:Uncharacterized protein n=1 Tax=Phrynocephalus forsythii TaxID=171643 RepID=A0A9Q0XWY7_9SAUR|nr:hypothetical protein JRQ81_014242 [Phrynocephalus forsythii]
MECIPGNVRPSNLKRNFRFPMETTEALHRLSGEGLACDQPPIRHHVEVSRKTGRTLQE